MCSSVGEPLANMLKEALGSISNIKERKEGKERKRKKGRKGKQETPFFWSDADTRGGKQHVGNSHYSQRAKASSGSETEL